MATLPARGPLSRRFDSWVRSLAYYRSGRRRPVVTRVQAVPGPDERVERLVRRAGWVLAVALPVLVCGALVLVRDDIDRSTAALVLVVPVVVVAVVGGPGPAALAGLVAPLAFDVLMTRPYYRLDIHAVEDVEAAVILLAVGLLVGQLVASETRSRVLSTVRGAALGALMPMVAVTIRPRGDEVDLEDRAAESLRELLDLREARWDPGFHGTAHPVLTAGGDIVDARSRISDRAPLPATGVELPVLLDGRELGRFILRPASRTPVSREERLVAVAIADLFGFALGRRGTA